MKKTIIFLLFLTMQSCSGMTFPRFTPKQKGVDKEFEPFIQEYKNVIGLHAHSDRFKKLNMNFANLESPTIGMCWWTMDGQYEIEIDRNYWYGTYYTYIDKQFTIYHELEHCIRYRLHTNRKLKIKNIIDVLEEIGFRIGLIPKPGYLPDGCPASIMHSHSFTWECQNKHYRYYIEEMQQWND